MRFRIVLKEHDEEDNKEEIRVECDKVFMDPHGVRFDDIQRIYPSGADLDNGGLHVRYFEISYIESVTIL